MVNKSSRFILGTLALGLCVGIPVSVFADSPTNGSRRPPSSAIDFSSKPGADAGTDCVVPKSAGTLKSTHLESDTAGIALWSVYEDVDGNVRVYRLYHPRANQQQIAAMAAVGRALTGVDIAAQVATQFGPAGSSCEYVFRIAR